MSNQDVYENDGDGTNDAPKTSERVQLRYPVRYKGESREEITLRRPRLADLKRVQATRGTDADRAAAMIQILSGWSPEAVDMLDTKDVDSISKVIESFT